MFVFSFIIEVFCFIVDAIASLFNHIVLAVKKAASKLPKEVVDEVARALLTNIIVYFESDNGKKEYEEWKKKNKFVNKKKAEANKKEQSSKAEKCPPDDNSST